jgi:hypothetical protein
MANFNQTSSTDACDSKSGKKKRIEIKRKITRIRDAKEILCSVD